MTVGKAGGEALNRGDSMCKCPGAGESLACPRADRGMRVKHSEKRKNISEDRVDYKQQKSS